MDLLGTQFIAGQPSAHSASTFTAINPASGQSLSPAFHESAPDEIDQACTLAEQASAETRHKSPVEKAKLLRVIADQILALGDELIVRANQETALPRPRLESERGRTCNQLRLFADLVEEGSWVDARIDRALPDRQPIGRPDLRRMLVPLGPVAVFGASNFPLAFSVAGGDTASALAAGCPVVVKSHPAHPGTSELVARACIRAIEACGFPSGTFALLQGASVEVGLHLVRHPAIQAIGFTGSLRAGRAIYDQAARRPQPIPVYAEMGSTNPVFILPGALAADPAKLAKGLAASVTLGVGQFCTKPGLVFVPAGAEWNISEQSSQFLQTCSQELAAIAPGVMLTPGIQQNFQRGTTRLSAIEHIQSSIVTASTQPIAACQQQAIFFHTTAQNLAAHPEIADEVFGPSVVAITASTREQLLQAARNLHGHLTATIHGTPDDLAQWRDLVEILQTKVGRIIFNGWPTGVEVSHAMQHGGPYPATTDSRSTSVGTAAILRFARPLCWQNFPDPMLAPELQDSNPMKIWRQIDGKLTRD